MSDQTDLNVILDGIEERGRLSCNSDELRAHNAALVKALRKAIEAIRIMADNQDVMIRSDISPSIELEQIAAILQPSSSPSGTDKAETDSEERGGQV